MIFGKGDYATLPSDTNQINIHEYSSVMSRKVLVILIISALNCDYQSMACMRRPPRPKPTDTGGQTRISRIPVCTKENECVTTASCHSQHRDAHSDALNDTILFLCGDAGTICCPPVEAIVLENHPNRRLITGDCGATSIDLGTRISLGETITWAHLPWMAMVGITLGNSPVEFVCGGSVINRRYVLTAAHCVSSRTKVSVVRLFNHNSKNVADNEEDSPEEDNFLNSALLQVSRITIHPEYNNRTLKNDIALIRLKSDVIFSDDVRPICLPFGFGGINSLKEGTNYTIAGWGMTGSSMPRATRLQRTFVQGITHSDCNYMAPRRSPTSNVGETQLCANNFDMGLTCKGDSGGPLMVVTESPRRFVAMGIVSYGFGLCDEKGSASVYTRVQPYLRWILDNIEK